ncbi:MAG: hypothetical protein HKM06_02645, partial [Spirochaetales bacterium]|nr:hypothetical protein [Spirochaetales bacterium]
MKRIGVFFVFLALASALQAQVPSKKQDIALFSLSSGDPSVPRALMEGVDAQIKQTLLTIGRFNVLGLAFRLDNLRLKDFVAKLKLIKEQSSPPNTGIQFGEQFLTLDEYNKIAGSFLVVIPRVTGFQVIRRPNNVHEADIETTFTILRGSDLSPIPGGFIQLRTQGFDRYPQKAAEMALQEMIPLLTFDLRKVPQFQITSGVLDVGFETAKIELGRNLGIMVGDEYSLRKDVTEDGVDKQKEVGLIIVRKVNDTSSDAFIAYGNPFVGETVHEIPRLGVDVEPYVNLVHRFTSDGDAYNLSVGIQSVYNRGFWDVKPLFGIEVPLILDVSNVLWLPFYSYLGAEFYPLRLGRFDLTVSAALAGGGAYILVDTSQFLGSNSQPFYWTHIGARAEAKAQFLFSRDAKIAAMVGGAAYLGLLDAYVGKSSFFKSSFQLS